MHNTSLNSKISASEYNINRWTQESTMLRYKADWPRLTKQIKNEKLKIDGYKRELAQKTPSAISNKVVHINQKSLPELIKDSEYNINRWTRESTMPQYKPDHPRLLKQIKEETIKLEGYRQEQAAKAPQQPVTNNNNNSPKTSNDPVREQKVTNNNNSPKVEPEETKEDLINDLLDKIEYEQEHSQNSLYLKELTAFLQELMSEAPSEEVKNEDDLINNFFNEIEYEKAHSQESVKEEKKELPANHRLIAQEVMTNIQNSWKTLNEQYPDAQEFFIQQLRELLNDLFVTVVQTSEKEVAVDGDILEKILKHLEDASELDLMNDPHRPSCGHRFSKDTLDKMKGLCPYHCQTVGEPVEDTNLKNFIDALKV